jgi:hypothetical protein
MWWQMKEDWYKISSLWLLENATQIDHYQPLYNNGNQIQHAMSMFAKT